MKNSPSNLRGHIVTHRSTHWLLHNVCRSFIFPKSVSLARFPFFSSSIAFMTFLFTNTFLFLCSRTGTELNKHQKFDLQKRQKVPSLTSSEPITDFTSAKVKVEHDKVDLVRPYNGRH